MEGGVGRGLRRPSPPWWEPLAASTTEGGQPESSPEASYTSSMRAMGALSPWRGPSFRMRV